MITTFAMGLALLAPQAPVGRWGKGALTPEALARRVDARLASLSKATLKYYYTFDKQAASGTAFGWFNATVVDGKRFRIELPHFDPTKAAVRGQYPFELEAWVADGKRFGAAVGKDPVPGPMARRPGVPPRPATVWFKDFSQVILAGVGQPVHPFASLIADGRRQGYRVSTETRTIPYKGRKLVHHRLLLKKGPAQFEIVIDPMGDVPVSVTNMIGNDSSRWSAVNWDLKPGKDLNPYEARFMKPGQARDIAPRPRRS